MRSRQKVRTVTVANELVRAETAAILRHARVIQIKRAAFGLTPIGFPTVGKLNLLPQDIFPKRPRAVFILPPRYARLLRACIVLRAPR
jgi:hypothetical protein